MENPVDRVGAVLVETYRIDRLIGEGGMGSVYEATHVRLPKRFAVKFLNLSLLGNLEALLRFRREAEIVAALDHPNIVSLFDYNLTDDGVPYVVLEFLDGDHLGKRIARGRLTVGETMRILVPVAQALEFAHQRDIVHRDLKPENIILSRNGESVKVVDFGIAKIRGGLELTAHNTILGTVPYMAPEQLTGGKVDARCDQFALGALVYEMLSGQMAFAAESVPAAAAKVAHFNPDPIRGVSGAINRAVARALAKAADERFPSVEAFARAMVEAASEPEEASALPARSAPAPSVIVAAEATPSVIVSEGEDEGLPPLAGEATAISERPMASEATAITRPPDGADEEDEVAEPPERSPQITDRTPAPTGLTREMPAVALGWEDSTAQVGAAEPVMLTSAPTAIGLNPKQLLLEPDDPTPEVMDAVPVITDKMAKVDPADAAPPSAPPETPAIEANEANEAPKAPSPSTGEVVNLRKSRSSAWIWILLAGLAGAGAGLWFVVHH